MGRAIVIAVILQSDPSIKMYMGLRAGKQQKPRTYTHPIRHIRESEIVTVMSPVRVHSTKKTVARRFTSGQTLEESRSIVV
jgi:hypothetical protein